MSQKLRSKSLSSPEILRRDPYAFVDWHHDPRNVHITDILLDREEGSPSSSEEMLWDLLPRYESPASSRGSLDWLGEHLTPVTTHGPWRFETEEDPSDEEQERSEYFVEILKTYKHLEFANFSIHNNFFIAKYSPLLRSYSRPGS